MAGVWGLVQGSCVDGLLDKLAALLPDPEALAGMLAAIRDL